MAVDEESRHDLYDGLVEKLGQRRATTLMEHLPPVGWGDVATKRDLQDLRVATKRDLDDLRVAFDDHRTATKHDLTTELGAVHARFAGVDADFAMVHKDIESLRQGMVTLGDGLRHEIAAHVYGAEVRIERSIRDQTRTYIVTVLGTMVTLAGVLAAIQSVA